MNDIGKNIDDVFKEFKDQNKPVHQWVVERAQFLPVPEDVKNKIIENAFKSRRKLEDLSQDEIKHIEAVEKQTAYLDTIPEIEELPQYTEYNKIYKLKRPEVISTKVTDEQHIKEIKQYYK
jgi:hypothetical protein